MSQLDEIDIRILRELAQDGRLSIVELATKVGLSHTPVRKRVIQLEKSGVIAGYHARISYAASGKKIAAFLELTLRSHNQSEAVRVQKIMAAFSEVRALYIASGDVDLICQVLAKDMNHYQKFLTEKVLVIPEITEVKSTFVLKALKEDEVSLPEIDNC